MIPPRRTMPDDISLVKISELPYEGNFTIKFNSKEQLEMLQSFFGVRRTKFDMALLDDRKNLKSVILTFSFK
jgi:hypothetical protein